ncbi:MAG: hypothetical protein K2P76_01350 [Lachnospiraceae bacterium]|nr:hypothetical protein [Lachnospiraceae bacterium]
MKSDMTQLIDSMENSIKLQHRARANKRAEKAAREKREFQEKLMRAAMNEVEIQGKASRIKGNDDAVQRDQLMTMMMAGF